MSRISAAFAALKKDRKKALITFITAGDPDLATTEAMIPELEKAGADVIELGIPFSDPMADGPTIQLSSQRALESGTTLPQILAMIKKVRERTQVPIVLMGYYNPLFIYGIERFAADAAAAGADGVLPVDLPPEEAAVLAKACAASGLDLISLLTPTSGSDRVKKVLKQASGFVYYVSVTGVTGARSEIPAEVRQAVSGIKEKSSIPVVVGFGISAPEQAADTASFADGVVVGSALVSRFEKHSGGELKSEATSFVASLRNAMDA